ncbi:hypothetical protein MKD01_13535 [[Clostridium] innocuum]|jgi:hypothetical protein|uniref:Uncharacterized protein n=2 Tax=Clostridium innocuum TaxID=1522 RepID=A0A099I3A3_CLOIN|nr:hypothetical protein [[Clostridium] innocuum]KGJ51353.1 hypothetical protein CIAN88_21060 [[Clostridium] innocuum]MCR0133212.1 hypothetical protein [[Clostridium] innocuum]MCR0163058.1 hypothetical protein [[Clostridium] innocuum]MCR0271904.1 hypothetical protein [[Clostridium] innocuum]MCR0286340.1 hypothetical protein [[Clostridium] innocuum]
MSRRDVQLQQMREQRLVETTSKIYASTVAEVLSEAGLPKEDIEYVLSQVMNKAEDLSKGYIDVDTYVESVEEKTGITLK